MQHSGESSPVYDPDRYKRIAGNASDKAKKGVTVMQGICMRRNGKGFGDAIGGRLDIVSADVLRKADEPEKLEGKVVCEIGVEEGKQLPLHIIRSRADLHQDMLNGVEIVHGACLAYFIDMYVPSLLRSMANWCRLRSTDARPFRLKCSFNL